MNLDRLLAISPIDGSYSNKCTEFQEIFSEFGLIKRRILVECTWLEALCDNTRIKECKALPLPKADKERLLKLTPANYVGLAEKLAKLA